MTYRVYVGTGCHDCDKVLEWLQAKNITVEVHDLDNDHTPPPIDVFARPALFEDDSLKAYGMDIIDYFEKRSA